MNDKLKAMLSVFTAIVIVPIAFAIVMSWIIDKVEDKNKNK